MTTELIISLLKKQPLFKDLSDAELRELAAIAKSERFPEKARIVEQGELKPVYYIILSGEAIARSVDEFGKERPVRFFKEGDSFGETSLLVGEPRDATVVARTDLEVLYIEKSEFDALLSRKPEIRQKLRPRPEVKRLWEAPRYEWMVKGEVIVWLGHRHWLVLFPWLIISLLLFILSGLLALWIRGIVLMFILVFLLIAWAGWSSIVLWNWRFDRYIITNRRVALIETIPYHIAARHEAPLERIQGVDIERGFPKTIFGVGDIIISTAARTQPIVFQNISRPEEVERIINEQKARALRWERAEERERIRRIMFGEEIPKSPPSEQPKSFPLAALLYPLRGEKREANQVTWYTHWWVLVKKIWLPGLTFLLLLISASWLRLEGFLICMFLFLLTLNFLWFLTRGWDWANERYIVTPEQIVMLRITPVLPVIPPVWIFSRITRKMAPMSSVQDVTTRMGIWGRIIGMGDVLVTTAAPAGVLEFKNVRNPSRVQGVIFEFLQQYYEAQKRERLEETRRLLEDWFQVHREIEHS
ncbi:MAG: cyclic nucleotide-binding domain-containing protein [Anaerolineae bacterium]|nr:cyclic nucleotide-binding domain-containing protein [Anaerolineae bacterium]MDW8101766.1 cyclic nucleotide-binding domain-containing protein [Anaerolineae bacterium]